MPSGTKKRKAAKKKTKKEEAQDSNDRHSSGSSNHFHGSEDPKSFAERESDGVEFEREEEEEKGEVGGQDEVVDQREGDVAMNKGLEEEVVRVEMEAKSQENGSESADPSTVDVEKETHSLPDNGGVEDKEVAVVEEEKSMVSELGELKDQDDSSALLGVPGEEIPKVVDYVSGEVVGVEGASVEELDGSVEERTVLPPQEFSARVSDVVDSELMKNVDLVSKISDEKEKFSSAIEDQQSKKIETEVAPTDEDKSLYASAVNTSSSMDAIKAVETGKQLEEQVVAPATTTSQVLESVRNGESMQSNDHVVATVANTSREVDNGKDLETQKQPLKGSNPLRRTSWTGCCGLFEVFSRANR